MISARDALELGQILAKDRDRVDSVLEIINGLMRSKSGDLISRREYDALIVNLNKIKMDLNTAVRALPGEKPPHRSQY